MSAGGGAGRPEGDVRPRRALARRALAPVRAVRDYLGAMMGENAYRVYLEHHAEAHPGGPPPMSERAFWKERMDDQDRNPGARCC